MHELMKDLDHLYEMLIDATTAERPNIGYEMVAIIVRHPQVQKYWEYNPTKHFWKDRFVKVAEYVVCAVSCTEVAVYEDRATNLRLAPSISGLYFLANSVFNPHTGEKYYWVKIGRSKNIYQRMSDYRTCNPSVFPIGYFECEDTRYQEKKYQGYLRNVATYRNQNNDEWWMVDEDTYLAMCEKSFDFFEKTY